MYTFLNTHISKYKNIVHLLHRQIEIRESDYVKSDCNRVIRSMPCCLIGA